MERLKRRLWTMATIALAGVVIAATLISGLFQMAVYLLPAYRDDLSVWVTEVAGRPVQIGGISLVWRGASPRLDLSDITLYSEDGEQSSLSAQRLSLGISLWRLLAGDLRPSRIELSGLNLELRVDDQGRLSLIGFETGQEFSREDAEKWLSQLENFRQLRLQDCEITLETPSAARLQFGLRNFDATRTLAGFDADAELRLPPTYGEELRFEAEIAGEIAKPGQWNGGLSGSADGLLPQPWLRGLVAPGTAAGVDELEASFTGRIDSGGLAALTLTLAAENFVITRAGLEQIAPSINAEIALTRPPAGWRADLRKLQLDDEDQIKGSAHYAQIADGYELGADAELLRLNRLAPYLIYARGIPADAEQLAGLSGELGQIALRLRRGGEGDRYSFKAQLKGLSLPPGRSGYGLSGLNGSLSVDEAGGSLSLPPGPLQLSLPLLATRDIPFSTLSGNLAWKREGQDWRFALPQFAVGLAGARANGQLGLWLPADPAQSPQLDLSASFSASDVVPLKAWMPKVWGDALNNWLRRGVVAGRVPAGQLVIRGPLRQFPFLEPGSGEWQLDIDAADGRLDYGEGWPPLEQLQAHLAFRGNGLVIESRAGQIAGSPLETATARFADFRDQLLTVDAGVSGETSSFYQLLRASPLAERLSALLKNTSAAGPSGVGLHLDIPLIKIAEVKARGTVALNGVQMYYQGMQEPINDIRGTLAFDANGVTAEKISAQFADLSFDARIEPRAGTQGVVVAEFPYTINPEGEGLSAWVPELVRRNIGGETAYRAELPLGADHAALSLSSELAGMEVRLPAPLAKSAADAARLRVTIGADAAAPVRVNVDYENRLGADIAFKRMEKDGLQATGINLRLGPGDAPPAAATDLRLRGQVAELDVAAWGAALKGAEIRGLTLKEADLSAERWIYQNQMVQDARLQLSPVADGWDVRLEGTGAEGTARYRKADGGRFGAKLSRLSIALPLLKETVDGESAASTSPALDPNGWPLMDLDVGQLGINGASFGALQLSSSRLGDRGQKIETLKIGGGVLDASASGEWLREAGQSSARLKFAASSGDVAGLLKSLGFAQSLSAEQSRVDGDLAWEASAPGLDWAQARGRVDLAFDNGTLKAVEPGAGRVLGLLNFYALPRRLTLDFRDVVNAGLGFDRITGGFDLGGGSALTDNVNIEAPSLRMELRGRVGLAARDYDQRVTVFPDVSPGVTLGAALLGGPAAAAIAFLAQEVLEKPLDQITQFSYRVTGSWENPQVKRIESASKPAPPVGSTRPRN